MTKDQERLKKILLTFAVAGDLVYVPGRYQEDSCWRWNGDRIEESVSILSSAESCMPSWHKEQVWEEFSNYWRNLPLNKALL